MKDRAMTIHTFATWDSPAEREREKHRNHKPSQSEALRGKESKKRKTERERREQNLIPCSRWTQKRRQEWQRWKTFFSDYILLRIKKRSSFFFFVNSSVERKFIASLERRTTLGNSSFFFRTDAERTLSSKRERTAFWFLFRWKNVLKNE